MVGDFGDPAYIIADVVQRIRNSDETLISIHLFDPASTEELLNFVDALLNHPNVVESIYLEEQQLSDDLGVLLTQYVASSQTIRKLYLSHNQLGESTYRAFATALHANTSLRKLMMENNSTVDDKKIDEWFTEALKINPNRPNNSVWHLYSYLDDFYRLQSIKN